MDPAYHGNVYLQYYRARDDHSADIRNFVKVPVCSITQAGNRFRQSTSILCRFFCLDQYGRKKLLHLYTNNKYKNLQSHTNTERNRCAAELLNYFAAGL